LRKRENCCPPPAAFALDAYFNDAARGAYLAAYNAAQAYITDQVCRPAKTHRGVHTQFAQMATIEPRIDANTRSFLTEGYNLKAIADYEFGPDADIPAERAVTAVKKAEQFVDTIASLLPHSSP
jgi:uncharacterized protein (UPF0332 family)